MPQFSPLAIVFFLLNLALGLTVIVFWFSNREELREYTSFGVRVSGGFCAMSAVALVAAYFEFGETLGIALPIAALVIDFFKIILVVSVGAYCASLAGYSAFPLLRPRLGRAGADAMQPATVLKAPAIDLRSRAVWVLILVAGWLAYSKLLFLLFSPEISETMKQALDKLQVSQATSLTPATAIAVSVIAISEELAFRLGIQNLLWRLFRLKDNKYWVCILLTSIIWTIGHTGVLEPDWVKLAQVFPAGLALGWMFKKHGIESCIAAHLLFNLTMPLLGL